MESERISVSPHVYLRDAEYPTDLDIREALGFRLQKQFPADFPERGTRFQFPVGLFNIVEPVKEPPVDTGQLMDPVYGIAGLESGCNGKNTGIGRVAKRIVQIVYDIRLVADESVGSLSDHPKAFLDRFFEIPSDCHHFPYALHAGPQHPGNTFEFCKIPARDFTDNIIERRLEKGRSRPGYAVFQLEKTISETQFCRNGSERITGRLGGEGGRTAEPGVDLDDPVVLRHRIEGILHIAFSDDAEMADNRDGQFPEKMILVIGQGLRRGDNDTLPRMDPEGIEILHVTDRHAIIETVPDYLILNLFPSLKGFLDKDLGGKGEGLCNRCLKFFARVTETGSEPAEGIGSPDDDRISDIFRRCGSLGKGCRSMGADALDADLIHPGPEQFPVFRVHNGPDRRSQYLYTIFFKDSASK